MLCFCKSSLRLDNNVLKTTEFEYISLKEKECKMSGNNVGCKDNGSCRNNIKERIQALRIFMEERNIAAYMVPTDDFHGSEYVGEYFKCREFITGFTGSAGTAVIMRDKAGLWTDGRYFLQAEEQFKGTNVILKVLGDQTPLSDKIKEAIDGVFEEFLPIKKDENKAFNTNEYSDNKMGKDGKLKIEYTILILIYQCYLLTNFHTVI